MGLRILIAGCSSLDAEARGVLKRQATALLKALVPVRAEFDLFDPKDARVVGRFEQWSTQREIEERWMQDDAS